MVPYASFLALQERPGLGEFIRVQFSAVVVGAGTCTGTYARALVEAYHLPQAQLIRHVFVSTRTRLFVFSIVTLKMSGSDRCVGHSGIIST